MELFSKAKIRFTDCDPMGHLNNSRYIDYMLNAREDHMAEHYEFTHEEYAHKTACVWVVIQNEIAYLKEVKYNKEVIISSKLIELSDRTCKIELLMKDLDTEKIYAVLWCTFIHFNLKSRKSEVMGEYIIQANQKFLTKVEQSDFQSRANYLRTLNK